MAVDFVGVPVSGVTPLTVNFTDVGLFPHHNLYEVSLQ